MIKPIEPGTIINDLPIQPAPLKLTEQTIKVKVPARIHLSVLDMTLFRPGFPGGGGIGYAIDLQASASVKLTQEPSFNIESNRPAVSEHVAKLISSIAGYSGGMQITSSDHGHNHIGLGSTSATLSAVAYGVNEALGRPLEIRDIRRLIGYNFVEESPDGRVMPGFETGVGPAAGYHGGFVVLSNDLEVIGKMSIPEDRRVVVIVPNVGEESTLEGSQNAGEAEAMLLLNRARELDERDKEKKAHECLINMLPGMLQSNLKEVGECVWMMQHLGSKVAEIEHHQGGGKIYEIMNGLRSAGAEVVGMSSVGPAIAAIYPETGYDEIMGGLTKYKVTEVIDTRPNNYGVKVERK